MKDSSISVNDLPNGMHARTESCLIKNGNTDRNDVEINVNNLTEDSGNTEKERSENNEVSYFNGFK